MADINLTSGPDLYVHPEARKDEFNNYFGLEGDDVVRVFQGTVIGGPGNDRIERIAIATEPWRQVGAAYWNSPGGIEANLAEGFILDGWGGRDTVVGVTVVHGSGQNDKFIGDAADNFFHPNGGTDSLDGGAGFDGFDVREIPPDASGTGIWRPARMSDLNIAVAVDGRTATISVKHFPRITYSVTNMEYFRMIETNNQQYLLADFITPQSMAEQAIAAGGSARWNAGQALGSAAALTFSFVTQSNQPGFRAFTAAEQQLVREILAKTAQIAGLTFTEVNEASAAVGQLRFGVSQQALSKGQAFLPGQNGDQAGDVWMDVESMVGIAPGSEGYAALLHEIGHGLGLRHPRNTDPGDAWAVQLRAQDDRPSLTVMSGVASSDGLFRADWGPLDVLALRHLYGTRMLNQGDTVYTLGERESAAQTTLVDDGGIDTVDASRMVSGVSIDLNPGKLSSAGVSRAGVAGVENLGAAATTVIENAIGSPYDDVILGNSLANALIGGLGNDWIEGGAGDDTAVFAGKRSDYELSNAFGKLFVAARDGVSGFDTLIGIERLAFADLSLTLAASTLGADVKLSVDEDASINLRLPDASDVERSKTSWKLVGAALHGSASISADGQLIYTPQPNYFGQDLVSFDIASGGLANRYIAYVSVLPVNDGPPVAKAANLLAPSGATLRGALPAASDIDGDPVSYALTNDSRNGEVVVAADGSFRYTARGGFTGSDSFGFIVSDGMGGSNTYSANVAVLAVANIREGSAAADLLQGQSLADALIGLAGNDRLSGAEGNDLLDGGLGIDTAVYAGGRNQFLLAKADFGWTLFDNFGVEGRDSLTGVERLKFANTSLALDLDGNAGSVAQIIRALFGPGFLTNKDFVGIGLQLFDGGMAYGEVVKLALGTSLFEQLAGDRSNTSFVATVFKNVVGRLPDAAELNQFTGLLNSGVYTQDSLAVLACQTSINTGSVELVGLAANGIEFTPQGG